MKEPDSTKFLARQYMLSDSFELYYYEEYPKCGVAPHSHSFYEFYFFLEGDMEMTIDSRNYKLAPGNIIIIPPGALHFPSHISSSRPYRRFVLWISKNYYEKYLKSSDAFEYLFQFARRLKAPVQGINPLLFNDLQNKIFIIIRELHENRFGKETQLLVQLQALLLNLSRFIYESYHTSNDSSASLRSRICTYIEAHIGEPLSLTELASAFYLSKFHIAHIFKESMGISIHQYIVKKRLEACKNALATDSSLENISARFGFASYSSFFRYFKKEYGISPKEYRNLLIKQFKKN